MSYQLALEAAGCEVLDFVEFGCYQGEWLALIRKDGVLGFVKVLMDRALVVIHLKLNLAGWMNKAPIIRNVLLHLVKATYQLTALKK